MADIGYTGPFNDYRATAQANNINQLAQRIVVPTQGTVLVGGSIYAAGYQFACRIRVCLWRSDGTLLAQSGDIVMAMQPFVSTGFAWHTGTFATAYTTTAANQVLYVGWWRDPAHAHQWPFHTTNAQRVYHNTAAAEPTTLPIALQTGAIGAYVTTGTATGGGGSGTGGSVGSNTILNGRGERWDAGANQWVALTVAERWDAGANAWVNLNYERADGGTNGWL